MGGQSADVQVRLHLLRRRQQGHRRTSLCLSASRCPTRRSCPTQASNGRSSGRVNLKCVTGADAGTEVMYKPTTVGGVRAVAELIETVRDRLNGGQHDGRVSPIVLLEKDTYHGGQYGKSLDPGADRSSTGCR